MSLSLTKVQQFRQPPIQNNSRNADQLNQTPGSQLLGGVFRDTRHVWHAKDAILEVRDTKTGCKVGGWEFGSILRDSHTNIVCVEEICRPHKRLSLLAVGLECSINGGVICFFDVFSSKVVRAIQVDEKITSLHIVDPGIEDLNLPGPLRNYDGILSVGTQGGHVYLVDICRQICEESLRSVITRDELNPCQLVVLTARNITRIEQHKEKSVQEGNHLAIHLNAVLESQMEHFTLKGPKGDDRVHVNKEEVLTSGLYYCSQLTSLLVGYNFGAFQLWNLTSLQLVYTSPVCDEHLPVNKFALLEPADDPRAFCYVWVSYSNTENHQRGLPFAVMYSVCYESKEYHEGYGFLYQDFQYCAVRFQVELGPMDDQRTTESPPKGGYCLDLQPITKAPAGKDLTQVSSGDTLALCQITWSIWHTQTETKTYTLLFDLNQWYKDQMPSFTKWTACSNYMLRLSPNEVPSIPNKSTALGVVVDPKNLRQFVGVQRLEEHFHPSALSFDLVVLREADVVLVHNEGSQNLLLSQIEAAGPLCLIKPSTIARQALTLGLQPLFYEESVSQRELIMNVGLEHHLLGWLCKCATEWANGSFASAGCSLEFLLTWAFRRAVTLKSNSDRYCAPLFDFSQVPLDGNTASLLSSCVRQINNVTTLYAFVLAKLSGFLVAPEVVAEQHSSLQSVSVYFEVLQWLVNVGLLPECPVSSYPRRGQPEKISAPYPVGELVEFYEAKRARLRSPEGETLLFIDNLVERKCGGARLRKQWQEDGGSGLYPPPSLQSLVRAYLIEGAGIGYTHSLVIYLFLDLAMALDQNEYSAVITYLIKFPAVFKVSTSSIKITQAFWQLDHGDFTTALEHLLDPFVLGEDLQEWHHSVIMRSLCVQKQHNYALLYLQTARPPMKLEKDVMTAVSLFVSNKMLDEAFYFMKQHQSDALLRHFFSECSKNNTLHNVLYKKLSAWEEKCFISFLEETSKEELQMYYYLLRSRFLEAFELNAARRSGRHERQGLIGHGSASRTDQVVRIFKSLLPDVSRKLVEYVRSEKKNLWREARKPTPLSVFIHNNEEQVRYKSTLIHAALVKAKQTDTVCLSSEVVTEATPFLRTPRARRTVTKFVTPVIRPNVVDMGGEDGSPSKKRLKLTPRAPSEQVNSSVHSIMLTPIVKRNTAMAQMDTRTPQSILKSKYAESEAAVDESQDAIRDSSRMGLQPRRALSRTPGQHVQFNIAARLSSSLSDQSSGMEITSLEDRILQGSYVEEKKSFQIYPMEDEILQRSSLSSGDISAMISTKDKTSSTNEDTFYSPDSSASEEPERIEPPAEREVMQSPKARRSYKRSHKEMSPVRSSPRLSKILQAEVSSLAETSQSEETVQAPDRILPKVKGRKSLSRKVLEHNAFSKLKPQAKTKSELSITKSEKTVVVEKSPTSSETTTVESKLSVLEVSNSDPKSPISQRSRKSTSNVSRISVLDSDISYETDTTLGSDIFLDQQPKIDKPEIPEWLNDYVASIQAKNNEERCAKEELEAAPVDVDETQEESGKEQPSAESPLEDTVEDEENEENDKNDDAIEKLASVETEEVVPMEIYDDLSCGTEESCPGDQHIDQSGYNELEINVIEPTYVDHSNETSYSSIPEAELAIIEVSPEKPESEVIEIGSSDDSGPNESFKQNIQEDSSSDNEEPNNEDAEASSSCSSERVESANDRDSVDSEKLSMSDQLEIDENFGVDNLVEVEENIPELVLEVQETSPVVSNEEKITTEGEHTVDVDAGSEKPCSVSSEAPEGEIPTSEEKGVVEKLMQSEKPGKTEEEPSNLEMKKSKETTTTGAQTQTEIKSVNSAQAAEIDEETIKKSDTAIEQTSPQKTAPTQDGSKPEKTAKTKVDQSTNTTITETESGLRLKSPKDSSSDTTLEGDTGANKIVVTAQVHTPTQRRTEEPLIRRVTRRSSLLLSQNERSPSIFDDTRVETNMNNSSSDDVFGSASNLTPTRLRARNKSSQNSEVIDCQSSTSKETVVGPKVAASLRKTRSASVDDVKTYSRKRTLKRSNSVDAKDNDEDAPQPSKGKGKPKSVSQMPIISEELSAGKGKAAKYVTSRRLTRSQASMVKENDSKIDLEDNNKSTKIIKLDSIDPITLLDKESYQGDEDPEEKKVYEGSSPSNSTVSSFSKPMRRKNRSASTASDISLPLSPTKSVSPEKKPIRKYESGVKTRLRKQSETGSEVSEKSGPSPTKKTKKNVEETDSEVSKPRTTRSRGNSVSSDVSNSSKTSTRTKRVILSKIDLTAIVEEKSQDADVQPIQKRQTRKRK